jgi:hypothetical protein
VSQGACQNAEEEEEKESRRMKVRVRRRRRNHNSIIRDVDRHVYSTLSTDPDTPSSPAHPRKIRRHMYVYTC